MKNSKMRSKRKNNLPTKWGFEPRNSEQFFVENVNNLDFGIMNKKINHFDKEQPVSLQPTESL